MNEGLASSFLLFSKAALRDLQFRVPGALPTELQSPGEHPHCTVGFHGLFLTTS